MGSSVSEPLVPPFVDLRTFDEMPLNVVRLLNADILFETTGDEFKAAVLLWSRAWHQVPAGSLPDDDAKLAYMAGLGRDLKAWKKVKAGALRGFFRCSDGRLYHEVICETALKSWAKKAAGKEGAEARWNRANSRENNDSRAADPSSTPDSTYKECAPGLPSGESHGETMPRTELNRTDKKETPLPPKGDDEVFGQVFDTRFWPAYPSRGSAANPKKPAREKFVAACKRGVDPELIIAGLKGYASAPSLKVGTEFVKTAVVWLNQASWEQYVQPNDEMSGGGGQVDLNELELRARFWFGRRLGTDECAPWRPKLPKERTWPFPGKPPFHDGTDIPADIARRVCRDLGIDAEVEERNARAPIAGSKPPGGGGPDQDGRHP